MPLTETQRKRIAEFVQKWTYGFLISNTNIDRAIATIAATDAANEHARILDLTIREYLADELERRSGEAIEVRND
jgi:hypothetical protein